MKIYALKRVLNQPHLPIRKIEWEPAFWSLAYLAYFWLPVRIFSKWSFSFIFANFDPQFFLHTFQTILKQMKSTYFFRLGRPSISHFSTPISKKTSWLQMKVYALKRVTFQPHLPIRKIDWEPSFWSFGLFWPIFGLFWPIFAYFRLSENESCDSWKSIGALGMVVLDIFHHPLSFQVNLIFLIRVTLVIIWTSHWPMACHQGNFKLL